MNLLNETIKLIWDPGKLLYVPVVFVYIKKYAPNRYKNK